MVFEWDPEKAIANLRKHRVSFAEAASVLGSDFAITVADPGHSKQRPFYHVGSVESWAITVGSAY